VFFTDILFLRSWLDEFDITSEEDGFRKRFEDIFREE
jgi:hypothetical protein